jgi:arylsulfatase A-like enzyme
VSAARARAKTARAEEKPQAVNVILVSFDTLRPDYLHCYGHPQPLSPALDDLARRGASFTDAVANCGWTLPQHVTLLTGVLPLKHRLLYLRRRCRLAGRLQTLAEIFSQNGYLTFGFANLNPYGGAWRYGFYRGFRSYTDVFPYNNGFERIVEPIVESIRLAGTRPFFIYIHTNDTHEPFAAAEPFGSRWGSAYHNRYEGEVSYVDHHFGLILAELERLGLTERTLVVATSDHGTEFQEHGFLEKKLNLYDEILRIPLIMTLPQLLAAGKRVGGLCQTVDIAPTILEICSLPSLKQMEGVSLLPRMVGRNGRVPETVFAHTLHEAMYMYEHFCARSARHKFIRTVPFFRRSDKLAGNIAERFARLHQVAQQRGGVWRELYDLERDPGEQRNIIAEAPAIARQLECKLDAWIRRCNYKPRRPR